MKSAILMMLLLLPFSTQASPENVYHKALHLSSQGQQIEALVTLKTAVDLLSQTNIWQQRMTDAAVLIEMKQRQQTILPNFRSQSANMIMAQAYIQAKPAPEAHFSWIPVILAAVLPGSGHLWIGRGHDSWVAVLMVWPILILALWAFKRKMGPVTVFFGGMTAWLWSGTVFSVISLSERTAYEQYILWWQGLWQAAALPGLMP